MEEIMVGRNPNGYININPKLRLCMSENDMCIEQLRISKNEETGETKETWSRVTGYYCNLRQLMEGYAFDSFIDSKGDFMKFKEALDNMLDMVKKIPNILIKGGETIIIQEKEKIVYKDLSQKPQPKSLKFKDDENEESNNNENNENNENKKMMSKVKFKPKPPLPPKNEINCL